MADDQSKKWHGEVISKATESVLRSLAGSGVLRPFYLAGGTGLALHLGHRVSEDLDLFSTELFNEDLLVQGVQGVAGFSLVEKAPHTLHATIQGTKASFLGYAYPVLFPFVQFQQVAVADPRDIGCMKISAIASRGSKRDFVDLYAAAHEFGLGHLLELFNRKFALTRHNGVHVKKSLIFFDDAEKDPMPHMLAPVKWEEVKRFFGKEAAKLP
jgi:hypothetical protein